MATSIADGEAMVKAAADAGRRLMVAYRVHHEPINGKIRQMLKERKHGGPRFVVFVANCTSSYGTAKVNRSKIICEKGWMAMDPATSYRGLKGEHGDEDEKVTMKEPEAVNQFAAEFDHFARCIREDTPVESPGEDGLRDLRLMLKIYEAARSGRTLAV